MNSQRQIIFDILCASIPEIKIYGGFGYCAYCSKLLYSAFQQQNIPCVLLLGEYLSDSETANNARLNNISTIHSFSDDGSVYQDIKNLLTRRKNRLPSRTGHVVIESEGIIYDLTCGQFGINSTYPIEVFNDMWRDVYLCSVVLDIENIDNFKLKCVKKKYPFKQI